MQVNLEKNGKPTGAAILNYCEALMYILSYFHQANSFSKFIALVPDQMFPIQLKQTVLAIQHLVDSGAKPQNIQLVGDSVGGTMIHQVLSHMLHPVEGVPALKLSGPLGGGYMMSPWTRMLDTPDHCLKTDREGKGDFLTRQTGLYWASKVLDGVPKSAYPYLNANTAPKEWLDGVDKHIKRILITAGEMEVLRDEIIKYSKVMEIYHPNTTTIMHENGIHIDPLFDFLVGDDAKGTLTPKILEWLDEGFSKTV